MCDTLVALSPATADGSVIFAKNSDRQAGEAQHVQYYPSAIYLRDAQLECIYITIPQARETHAVLLSQIDWMWGAEMGANDQGVIIGNEAVWTRAAMGPPALLGMDLLRLGLERGTTASASLDIITQLLETHGQGGACAENDDSFTYHNSFLIADRTEAWVLETAGKSWATERVRQSVRNISNGLTIRTNHDRRSTDLDIGPQTVDFADQFAEGGAAIPAGSRQEWGTKMLEQAQGSITTDTMAAILSDHESGICMHSASETTASMVSWLAPDGRQRHWMTNAPHPCQATFREVEFPQQVTRPQAAPAELNV